MVVAPSIVFYVLENGGTKEQYGIIVSAFSFASFCGKPFLGYWSDKRGFRLPYLVTLAIAAIGGFLYLIAEAYSDERAVTLILTARLLGGIGAASGTLGFAYLAKMVPHEEQTQVNSLLSMVRIIGLACGPGINIFLARIDMTWFSLHVNPLNSVGLILMGGNVVAMAVIYCLLDEAATDQSVAHSNSLVTSNTSDVGLLECARSLIRAEILVPMFGIFSFNAAFQL
jgi:ceroid-lipofuscinosis MFS transporter 7